MSSAFTSWIPYFCLASLAATSLAAIALSNLAYLAPVPCFRSTMVATERSMAIPAPPVGLRLGLLRQSTGI